MKIKYIHSSDPKKVRIYDTKIALKNNPFIKMPQEEFDKMEIENMKRNKEEGCVLSYEIEE